MTAQPAQILTIQPEDPASLSSPQGSSEREALNALFKLIEMTEPALLLCRDALAASRRHTHELKAVQSTLDHIGELKLTRLQFPGHPRGAPADGGALRLASSQILSRGRAS
jgi:hypothetical protein